MVAAPAAVVVLCWVMIILEAKHNNRQLYGGTQRAAILIDIQIAFIIIGREVIGGIVMAIMQETCTIIIIITAIKSGLHRTSLPLNLIAELHRTSTRMP